MKVFLTWSVYRFRNLLGDIWSVLIFNPFVFLLTIINLMRDNDANVGIFSSAKYVFYIEHWYDRALLYIFRSLARIGSWLSGVSQVQSNFGSLVTAKSDDIFIGLKKSASERVFGIRGKFEGDGARGVDIIWTSSLKPIGRFSVLSSEASGGSGFKIKCVWISGEFNGKGFTIGSVEKLDDLRLAGDAEFTPQYFFSQPTFYEVLVQILAIVGISSITDFLDVFSKLKPHMTTFLNFLKGLYCTYLG